MDIMSIYNQFMPFDKNRTTVVGIYAYEELRHGKNDKEKRMS